MQQKIQKSTIRNWAVFFFFIICTGHSASAQNIPNDEYYFSKNEVGVNVTSILSNVLSFNANNIQSPYGIFYRRRMNKVFFRAGLDLNSEKESGTQIDPGTGIFTSTELKSNLVNLRLGLEKNIQIAKNFQFFVGFDVFGHFENEKNTLNFSFLSEDTQYVAGAGPAIRLEYKLAKRVFISTESTLYFGYGKNKNEVFVDGNIFSSTNKSLYNLKLDLPMVLFISIQL